MHTKLTFRTSARTSSGQSVAHNLEKLEPKKQNSKYEGLRSERVEDHSSSLSRISSPESAHIKGSSHFSGNTCDNLESDYEQNHEAGTSIDSDLRSMTSDPRHGFGFSCQSR